VLKNHNIQPSVFIILLRVNLQQNDAKTEPCVRRNQLLNQADKLLYMEL